MSLYGSRHVTSISLTVLCLGLPAAAAVQIAEGDFASDVVIGAVLVWCLSAWVGRWILNRKAASAKPAEWLVRAHIANNKLARCSMLRLTPLNGGRGYWQRIMWHPWLDGMTEDEILWVRIGKGVARRAVVEFPEGTRILPAGRFRRWSYFGWHIRNRAPERVDGFPFPPWIWIGVPVYSGLLGGFQMSPGWSGAATMAPVLVGIVLHFWGWVGGLP
ncbi:hypothetical protein [Nonomuraea zeae]|uniref:Uncharacterized protein n=1 Tax=Nonomuraea zeae TaxID=1642303 RepID=A0A5S4GAL0_9ACTN|nr:hypothetical protein [Nonomuraea zeae]TMR29481.1 hypothetical protein ETD85_32320 [Nonomuraea zeae]